MAKDKFYLTKPHVNGGTRMGLLQIGFSYLGVLQITTGQMVTDPQERGLLAETLVNISHKVSVRGWDVSQVKSQTNSGTPASGQATGKRAHMPIRARLHIDTNSLMKLGFSVSGAQQIAMGAIVTDPQDRGLVADILTRANIGLWHQAICSNDTLASHHQPS